MVVILSMLNSLRFPGDQILEDINRVVVIRKTLLLKWRSL